MEYPKIKLGTRDFQLSVVVAFFVFAVLGDHLGIYALPEPIILLCIWVIIFYGIIEVVVQIVYNIPGIGWLMDNAEGKT